MSDETPTPEAHNAAGDDAGSTSLTAGGSEAPNANGARRCVFCEVPLHAWDVYLACPTCLYYAKLD